MIETGKSMMIICPYSSRGRQTTVKDIDLVNLGAKSECPEHFTKAGLDPILVVLPLMIMIKATVITKNVLYKHITSM